jgi:uncharacterized protein involved in exopolysaccharide biosynthesis
LDTEVNTTMVNETVSLFRLKCAYIIRKWHLFLIVSLLFGVTGFMFAHFKKPQYKSRLTFALDDAGSSGAGGFASLASQFGLNLGGNTDIFSGDNIIEIIKSRRMVERVLLSVDSFNAKPYTLVDYYLDISGMRKDKEKFRNVTFPIQQSRSNFSYLQDSVLNEVYVDLVKNHIDAQKPDRRLNIFEINITSPNEKFTKVMTERLVSETNGYYVELRTKKAKSTLDALENRIEAMRKGLNTSISSRAAAKDLNLNPVFDAAQVPVIQKQSEMEVYGAAYAEIFKNQEIARFQYLNNIPLLQIIDPADYPMEKMKSGRLKFAFLFSMIGSFLLFIALWIFGKPEKHLVTPNA